MALRAELLAGYGGDRRRCFLKILAPPFGGNNDFLSFASPLARAGNA